MINISAALLWGFFATLVLSTIVRAAREYGISRMDIPLMVGLIVTPDRDRARAYGFLVHLMNGWIFSFIEERSCVKRATSGNQQSLEHTELNPFVIFVAFVVIFPPVQ